MPRRRGVSHLPSPHGVLGNRWARGHPQGPGDKESAKRGPSPRQKDPVPPPRVGGGGSAPYLKAFLSSWPFSAGVTLWRHEDARAGTGGDATLWHGVTPPAPCQHLPGVHRPQPHPVSLVSPVGPGREKDVWGRRGMGVTLGAPQLRAGAAPHPPPSHSPSPPAAQQGPGGQADPAREETGMLEQQPSPQPLGEHPAGPPLPPQTCGPGFPCCPGGPGSPWIPWWRGVLRGKETPLAQQTPSSEARTGPSDPSAPSPHSHPTRGCGSPSLTGAGCSQGGRGGPTDTHHVAFWPRSSVDAAGTL